MRTMLWLDLETTGSDSEYDEIIEIGAFLTDPNLEVVGDPFEIVVRPTPFAFDRMMNNDVVREMHLANGLYNDCAVAEDTIGDAEDKMIRWLIAYDVNRGESRVILSGSGVSHFDRRFIHRQMPEAERFMVHWPIDVGVVRRFLDLSGVLPDDQRPPDKKHRALDDARLHLEEALSYRAIVRGAVGGG